MGNKILIYENGQRYEMDSDQIYVPYFLLGRRSGKTNMAIELLKQAEANGMSTLTIGNTNEKENILSEFA